MRTINPNKYYKLEDNEKESVLNEIKNNIIHSDSKLIQRMLKIVDKYVRNYRSDFFVHDLYTMSEYHGRLLWYVHDCGTYLVKLDSCFKETMELQQDYLLAVKANVGDVSNDNKGHYAYIVDAKNNKLQKLSTITNLDFTYQHQTKEEVLQHLIKDVSNKEFFEILYDFESEKKAIHTVKELEDFVVQRREIKKAI